MANMAVEARVSVSAMRGRFEQLEGSSPNSHLSTSPVRRKISTSPVRNNVSPTDSSYTSTSPVRRKISSSPVRGNRSPTPIHQEKTNQPSTNEFKKFSSISANRVVNHGANLDSFEDPLDGLAKKISENQQKGFRRRSDTMPSISVPVKKERDNHSPIRKSSNENNETRGKSGIIRRIPVFKSIEGGLLYDRRRHSRSDDDSKDSCEEDKKLEDSPGRTSRFLGHIRSKSHGGGGNDKRDSSVDKNEGKGSKERSGSQTRQKENILTREWKFFKHKSSDNVSNNNNNHNCNNNNNNVSTDTFEGKQKLVENIVKNMKNNEITLNGGMKSPTKERIHSDNSKEKSKSRKFSFTSKTEKELKNKIEKEVITPLKLTMQPVLPALPVDKKVPNADNETTGYVASQTASVPSTPQFSRISVELVSSPRVPMIPSIIPSNDSPSTVFLPPQADDCLSPDEMDTISPCSDSSLSTPMRPPRRRSAVNGLPHRKKNKAPSPPTSGSDSRGCDTPEPKTIASNSAECDTSDSKMSGCESHGYNTPEPDKCPESELWESFSRISWSRSKRKESASQDSLLVSPSLPDVTSTPEPYSDNHSSREQSPDYLSHSPASLSDKGSPLPFTTPTSSEPNSPIRKTSFMEIKLNKEELRRKQELDDSTMSYSIESVYPIERTQSPSLTVNTIKSTKSDKNDGPSNDKNNLDDNDKVLPAGPAPKKPPRTFAYDIYKSTKSCVSKEKNSYTTDRKDVHQVDSNFSMREPLYAMPQKKRSTDEHFFIPQITTGINCDLSKTDLNKPSIAPKPAHIVKKHKRLSMVDPLSTTEKEEDPALASEFQRQAHIRFSLRRPKKPPPAPPTNQDIPTATDSEINSYDPSSNTTVDTVAGPLSLDNAVVLSKPPPFSSRLGMLSSRGVTSRSTTNLQLPSIEIEDQGPMSLGYTPSNSHYDDPSSLSKKRSMSDETLYKGTLKKGEEPIYATPMLYDRRVHERRLSVGSQPGELHYMCSVLFTGEDDAAGRDGSGKLMHRNHGHSDNNIADDRDDGAKGGSSLISIWKREFRQSCRQVHNKIKKSVAR